MPEHLHNVPPTREGRIQYLLDMYVDAIKIVHPKLNFSTRRVSTKHATDFAKGAILQQITANQFFGDIHMELRSYKRRNLFFDIITVADQAIIASFIPNKKRNRLKAHRR